MPKKPFFLQGTIMDNLKLGQNEISDLEVIEVCKKVGIHSDMSFMHNTLLFMGRNVCWSREV